MCFASEAEVEKGGPSVHARRRKQSRDLAAGDLCVLTIQGGCRSGDSNIHSWHYSRFNSSCSCASTHSTPRNPRTRTLWVRGGLDSVPALAGALVLLGCLGGVYPCGPVARGAGVSGRWTGAQPVARALFSSSFHIHHPFHHPPSPPPLTMHSSLLPPPALPQSPQPPPSHHGSHAQPRQACHLGAAQCTTFDHPTDTSDTISCSFDLLTH
jgi:hypothetical protein